VPRKTFTFEGTRYSVTAETEAALAVKTAMKKRDLEEGRKRITKNMFVREWAEEYIRTYKRPSVGDSEYSALKGQASNHICPVIGGMRMKDVKPIHCQKIMNGLAGKSASSVHKVHILLKGMAEKRQVRCKGYFRTVTYCLRHTYATDLQAAGVPINVAKTFLGHEDISTTGNIYTHDSKASFEDARAKIDAFKNIPCATPCASVPVNR
jgi:hypothetical protein